MFFFLVHKNILEPCINHVEKFRIFKNLLGKQAQTTQSPQKCEQMQSHYVLLINFDK